MGDSPSGQESTPSSGASAALAHTGTWISRRRGRSQPVALDEGASAGGEGRKAKPTANGVLVSSLRRSRTYLPHASGAAVLSPAVARRANPERSEWVDSGAGAEAHTRGSGGHWDGSYTPAGAARPRDPGRFARSMA